MTAERFVSSSGKIIIVGGGIGGLTAALSLLRQGFDVDIYEQSQELREVGAGVQMGPNGSRVLHALGLKEALERIQFAPERREIRLWNTGETWDWFELGTKAIERHGSPHLMLHRRDLHDLLIEAVRREKADALHLGRKCIGITQGGDQAEATFDDGETVSASIVIGADGIHSRVRASLFGADAPEFTGCVAWRGLVPFERLPPGVSRTAGTNWLGPHGHVLHYPVRRGELLNFVGFVERDDWQVESWTVAGTTEELANDFRGWHADVQAIIENLDVPYKWALRVRPPMPRWSVGRVTLLGDACHPTLPFLGQGAVMAIEDGYVLAACLKKYPGDPATAFARYEGERKERTAEVVRKAAENRTSVFRHALADRDTIALSVAQEWQQERVRERMEWLYAYDATKVAV
jgi:salicylate hydroxylase